VGSFIPGVDLSAPEKVLADLIASAKSLDSEIANVEVIARQASTFCERYLLPAGGDLTGTRESLQNFLTAIQEYETKVANWRQQAADLKENAPRWIDQASVALTIFLLCSDFHIRLILHGLSMRRGQSAAALKGTKVEVSTEEDELTI